MHSSIINEVFFLDMDNISCFIMLLWC